jgi:hypothetical protein
MKNGYEAIASILEDDYDVSAMVATTATVVWVADKLLLQRFTCMPFDDAVKCGKAEICAINAARKKCGKSPVYIPFGHILF